MSPLLLIAFGVVVGYALAWWDARRKMMLARRQLEDFLDGWRVPSERVRVLLRSLPRPFRSLR